MKDIYVSGLVTGSDIISFFIVKSAEIRTDSNGRQYFDINLADKTGDVNGKKWDVSGPETPALSAIKEGDIVKVKAQVSEWQGQKQLRIARIRKSTDADGLDYSDYIKAAPEPSEEMYAYIIDAANKIGDPDMKKIALKVLTDNKERIMYYPAASRNHHAEYGGLLWHMKRMLMNGISMCKVYDFLDEDLVVTGVIIHDIEKLTEIDASELGIASGYSRKGQLLGHITQGVTLIDEISKELGVPEEKAVMLEHMILSHHYEPEFGSPKKPMFPEAEILHYLDIIDARMFDMEEALATVEPGSFTERVRTLDNRRLYKPTFAEDEGGDSN
ncbi:MAG: 3'-5' exoribonuclease YhaM family protein [Eubacterium sp.]|jgi:3'-5' exoribonuclease